MNGIGYVYYNTCYLLLSFEVTNSKVFIYVSHLIFTILQWFSDGTPLNKETMTTLRNKWAGYFLQIKNMEVGKIQITQEHVGLKLYIFIVQSFHYKHIGISSHLFQQQYTFVLVILIITFIFTKLSFPNIPFSCWEIWMFPKHALLLICYMLFTFVHGSLSL